MKAIPAPDPVPKVPPFGPDRLMVRPLEKLPENPTLLIGLEEWR